MVLEHGKWDPQVGDIGTLAPFPLILPAPEWQALARLAEQLASEVMSAERELLEQPDLMGRLGLPRRIVAALSRAGTQPTTPGTRVIRFDFHPTPEGWRISEANCDVPGGYTEASRFPRLMAEHFPGAQPAGDPADPLAAALASERGHLALVAATASMEDQQVTAYLAGLLRERGCIAHLVRPQQVEWVRGVAHLNTDWYRGRLNAVFRFYQAEWLDLRRGPDWSALFRGGHTPTCNPGSALLVESKRFPLVWGELRTPLNTWKRSLPTTVDPRRVSWRREPGWVLKTALCNTGDTVAAPGLVDDHAWRRSKRNAILRPGQWVAQRRFEVTPMATPLGPMYPCLGVFTIDGQAAGIYGRMGRRPLIDYEAIDIAVLIDSGAE